MFFVKILSTLMAVIVAVCVYFMQREAILDSHYVTDEKKKENIVERYMKNTRVKSLSYDNIMMFLIRSGMTTMFPNITPVTYYGAKIGLAALGGVLGYTIGSSFVPGFMWVLAAGLGFLGFMGPKLLANYATSVDNEEMLPDIKALYDAIRMQAKAGLFLSESLLECYRIVSNKRLKKALLELNGKILATNDEVEALQEFNQKFNNENIDAFCITMIQAKKSGQSVKMLEDIGQQINGLQQDINKKHQEAVNRKVMVITILVFFGIMITLLNGMGKVLSDNLSMLG